MLYRLLVSCAVCAVASCSLVKSSGLQTDYSFDAIEYASPQFGSTPAGTVPDVACQSSTDCSAIWAAAAIPANVSASCDTTVGKCVATAEIRVSETIDLSQQMESAFPSQAVQYGIDSAELKRITYWINQNQLNVATPSIDLYVAPTAAHDETDPAAVLVTRIANIAALSNVCGDPAYAEGDTKSSGAPVCSAALTDAGKSALAGYVKSYETPFQIIAHALITVMPGDPVPSGSISFAARPTVGLKILD